MADKFTFKFTPAKDFMNITNLVASMGTKATIEATPEALTFKMFPENRLGFLLVSVKKEAEGWMEYKLDDPAKPIITCMDLTNVFKWLSSASESETLSGTLQQTAIKLSIAGKDKRDLKWSALGDEHKPIDDMTSKFMSTIFASKFECPISRLKTMITGVTLGEKFTMLLNDQGILLTSNITPTQLTKEKPVLEGDESSGLIEVSNTLDGEVKILPDPVSKDVVKNVPGQFGTSTVKAALEAFEKFSESVQCGFSGNALMFSLPDGSTKKDHYVLKYVIMAKLRRKAAS